MLATTVEKTFTNTELWRNSPASHPSARVLATFIFRGPFVPSLLIIETETSSTEGGARERHVLALDPGVKADEALDLAADLARFVIDNPA